MSCAASRLSIEAMVPVIRAMASRLSNTMHHRVPADDLAQVGLLAVHTVLVTRCSTLAEDRVRARAGAAARNAMVDLVRVEMRSRSADRARDVLPLTGEHEHLPCPAPGPEAVAIKRQMARQVVEAISDLPRRLQDVLRLSYESEATHAEIAAMWGLDRSRISQMHAEAIALLRERLAPEPPAPPPAARPLDELFAPDIVRGASADLLTRTP